MKLYDCVVRPGGHVFHEVPRLGVSSLEIAVLREIHGDDGVVNVKESGSDKRAKQDEIDALCAIYPADKVNAVAASHKFDAVKSAAQEDAPKVKADDKQPALVEPVQDEGGLE